MNGQTTWTTNEEGTLTVTGIHASDFEDNASVDSVVTYCAQETKAPSGFQLDKTLIPFVLTASESEQALREGDARGVYEYRIKMKNHKSQLPNTGGMGIGLLIVLGLLVIGGGAYAARRNTAAA
ncbi:surface-anchored protein [Corynebacterium pilosum]|uniref:Surface-anchored protein n=1 Tax=Corynebacterium pilosum TaxID=35756 RepID=A0A376CKH8_9CORY|nr:surface-anchored protein [Corynebacterium pilosum]